MKKLRAVAVAMTLRVPAMARQKPAQVQPPPLPAFQPPTATEAFTLRSRCVKLADELKKKDDTITLRNWDEPEFDANYNARTNRNSASRS